MGEKHQAVYTFKFLQTERVNRCKTMQKYVHSIYKIINGYRVTVWICNIHQFQLFKKLRGPRVFPSYTTTMTNLILWWQLSGFKAITRSQRPADARVRLPFSLSLGSYLCIILGWKMDNVLPTADPPRNTSDGWTVRVASPAHSIKRIMGVEH